jgi:GR25 family glycosyltransferase involved in LPS biosynthesis
MIHNGRSIEVYVISLIERVDRRKRMEVSLRNRGIDFRYWDALKLTHSTREYAGRVFDPRDILGSPGCYMSHITLLERIYEEKKEGVLIMEDDVYNMSVDAKERIFFALEQAPKNCDMLYFEYILPHKNSLVRYNHCFHKIVGVLWGTACYYITLKGIERVLQMDTHYRRSIGVNKHLDIFYGEQVHKLGDSYAFYPKLCYQSESKPSIMNHPSFFDKFLDIRKTVNFRYLS